MDPMTPIDWTNWGDGTNLVRAIGFLIPVLTALITKRFASPRVKAVSTLVLSALTAAVATAFVGSAGFDVNGFVNAFMNTFLPAVAAYYGLLKPAGVTSAVADATSEFGLGSSDYVPRHAAGEDWAEGPLSGDLDPPPPH